MCYVCALLTEFVLRDSALTRQVIRGPYSVRTYDASKPSGVPASCAPSHNLYTTCSNAHYDTVHTFTHPAQWDLTSPTQGGDAT